MIEREFVCVAAARGLWLYGKQMRDKNMTRAEFCDRIEIKDEHLIARGEKLGVQASHPGLRFFDATRNVLAFGPGAGLVLSASIGTGSLRAALVDANGLLHNHAMASDDHEQLAALPDDLLKRLRDTFSEVLEQAFDEKTLLVDGKLPLLGVSVAWPTPMTRDKHAEGHALRNDAWRIGGPLDSRVARKLKIQRDLSNAVNDAAAAAIGVAYLQTTAPEHIRQENTRLAMVLRLAGGVGAATILVEPRERNPRIGITSGFRKSILIGGIDHLAGEIGHIPVEPALLEKLNRDLDGGLGELEANGCSCTSPNSSSPSHLEAFAGASAVARRVDPTASPVEVAERMLAEPTNEAHQRVLEDAGTLVGRSLVGPVAMLNPATVVITGALAVDPVATAIEKSLSEDHVLGPLPEVVTIEDSENSFIRVKGAGMVVLRRHLLRVLPELLRGSQANIASRVKNHATLLSNVPW